MSDLVAAAAQAEFARSFPQLLIARLLVGVGEASYGSAGAALVTSYFPARLRGSSRHWPEGTDRGEESDTALWAQER